MITLDDCKQVAAELGVEPEAVLAVARVESVGKIDSFLFEPHIFSRLTNRIFDETHPHLSYPKWDRTKYLKTAALRQAQFFEAVGLSPFKAYESASWGLFQIMGFHYKILGYPNALLMAMNLRCNIEANMKAFGNIIRHMGLVEPLRNKEWAKFARVYNGPGYKQNHYDTKMASEYAGIIKYGRIINS